MNDTNIGLNNIVFPVFRIGTTKPEMQEGVTFFLQGKNVGTDTEEFKMIIVDDKDMPGHSLAMRRLQMRDKGVELYKLSTGIFFLSDLIKLAKPGTWFIDKEGSVFSYTKTKKVRLIYRPIQSVFPLPAGGAVIEIKGIPSRFKVLYAPTSEQTHAGLLCVGTGFILYGLYDQMYEDTTRAI
jgi:hypothetical protein